MELREIFAGYMLGAVFPEQLPNIAYQILESCLSCESPSLSILAGLSAEDGTLILEKYFFSGMAELGILVHGKREAALIYAHYLASQILLDEKDLFEGCEEIKNVSIAGYDFRSESKQYLYDSIGFDQVFYLMTTYEDLMDELTSINKEAINQEINKLKKTLFEAVGLFRQTIERSLPKDDSQMNAK